MKKKNILILNKFSKNDLGSEAWTHKVNVIFFM